MRKISASVLIPIGCAVLSTAAHAQFGRGNNDWTTAGFDAQRSFWVRADAKISRESLSKPGFAMTWKIVLAKDSKAAALGTPVLLNSYIGYRGFRSFAFVGGAGDNVYTVDTDLSRLEWHDRLAPASAPSSGCAGSGVAMVARPSSAAFPAAGPVGRGGRGGPAHSGVGQPGEGAVTVAQLTAAANMAGGPGRAGRGGPGFDMNAMNAGRRMQNSLYVLTGDGTLHTVFLSSGEKADDPIRFLPPGAGARGLILINSVAYAATSAACGGSNGVSALDLAAKAVTSWTAKGAVAGTEGPAVGPDGTLYVASGGSSPAVTALEAKTLQQKDWYGSGQDLNSSPVIFEFKDKALLAVASKDRKILLLDPQSLGGGDHQTPLVSSSVEAAPESLASWQDASGTRWLLGNTEGAIRAWKVVDHNGSPALETAWVSQEIASPAPPMIVNGVVFASSKGSHGHPAVLYALDSATGKEMWNSGKTIAAPITDSGLSAGDTQVFVSTADGTLYAFGFPIEH
jgi:hypothetical protein